MKLNFKRMKLFQIRKKTKGLTPGWWALQNQATGIVVAYHLPDRPGTPAFPFLPMKGHNIAGPFDSFKDIQAINGGAPADWQMAGLFARI